MTLAAAPIKSFNLFVLSCFLSCSLLHAEDSSTIRACFIPPKNWKQADGSTLHSRVKAGFFNKTGEDFSPSINLTEEKVSLSPAEYLKAVQKIHESNPKNRWRKLGTIQTLSGTAFLTAIDTEAPIGEIRILQSLLVKEGIAYILTSATLKKQCRQYQQEILDSFKSLSLIKDSECILTNLNKKKKLEEKIKQLLTDSLSHQKSNKALFEDPSFEKHLWLPFKTFLDKEFAEQGAYWQILILEETEKKLKENLSFEKLQ